MASQTIEDVIKAILENRRRFKDFCYSLTPEQLARPVPGTTWIVRDFAAHLDTLDTALLRWFEGAAGTASLDPRVAEDGAPFDVDAFNDAAVSARRDWPLERIFSEADANRERLIASMRNLTDEQIERPMHFPGDSKRPPVDLPLKLFLGGWAQHDPIHVADMVKALPELAGDPVINAWLDNPFVIGYQAMMSGAALE
ncbi:MAG TPA: maleylpyruvate isomerase N-terminal domain-containing protein [Dehalococcoidia bacterium]|nr:maleylpyruvate isomerase N-terminal domain-containing protein [Dehalococcoidia bacterium]